MDVSDHVDTCCQVCAETIVTNGDDSIIICDLCDHPSHKICIGWSCQDEDGDESIGSQWKCATCLDMTLGNISYQERNSDEEFKVFKKTVTDFMKKITEDMQNLQRQNQRSQPPETVTNEYFNKYQKSFD